MDNAHATEATANMNSIATREGYDPNLYFVEWVAPDYQYAILQRRLTDREQEKIFSGRLVSPSVNAKLMK